MDHPRPIDDGEKRGGRNSHTDDQGRAGEVGCRANERTHAYLPNLHSAERLYCIQFANWDVTQHALRGKPRAMRSNDEEEELD